METKFTNIRNTGKFCYLFDARIDAQSLTKIFREQILSILPHLQVLDGEMLLNEDEDEISDDEEMKIDDAEGENLTDDEIAASGSKKRTFFSLKNFPETLRKPNIVTAMSLLIQELDNLDDIEELNTLLAIRSKKIRRSEVFEV